MWYAKYVLKYFLYTGRRSVVRLELGLCESGECIGMDKNKYRVSEAGGILLFLLPEKGKEDYRFSAFNRV